MVFYGPGKACEPIAALKSPSLGLRIFETRLPPFSTTSFRAQEAAEALCLHDMKVMGLIESSFKVLASVDLERLRRVGVSCGLVHLSTIYCRSSRLVEDADEQYASPHER